jgi:hypothetical protein
VLLEAERAPSLHDMLRGAAVTDAAGRFAFDGLAAGTYRVRAGGGGGSPFVGVVRSGVGAGTRDLRIELERGASISGRVVDPSGATPTSRVSVFATPLEPGAAMGPSPSTTMRQDGSFRLDGVRPGRHRVTAAPAMGPHSTGVLGRTVDGVEAGATDVALHLVQGVPLRIRIVREDGTAPGARARVTLRPSDARPADRGNILSGTSGEDGRFESGPVDPAVVWDIVVAGVPGTMGGRASGVKAGEGETTVTLERGGRIAGRVAAADGTPAAGVSVAAQAADARPGEPGASAWTRTGDDGTFALEGLGAFRFALRTVVGSAWIPVAVEGTFAPGATVEIRVTKGARLAGRLLDAAGRPVTGGTLEATPESNPAAAVGASLAADGSFTFDGLPPGRVALHLRREDARVPVGTFDAPGEGIEARLAD